MVMNKVGQQELRILLKILLKSEDFQDSVINQYLLNWPVLLFLFLWQTTHLELEGSKSLITDTEKDHTSFKVVPVC